MSSTEYLLASLAEEGGEVVQDCTKCLRFGLDDRNVLNLTGPTNRERLIAELNDLLGVVELLVENGTLPENWQSRDLIDAKKMKVLKFMVYAEKVGVLK